MHHLPRRLHLDIPLYLPLNQGLLWPKLLQWAVRVVGVGESVVVGGGGVKRENLGTSVYSGNERGVREAVAAKAVAGVAIIGVVGGSDNLK